MPAPSRMAWARSKSSLSAASAAALRAFQISTFPSNAGAVSQNSSRFDLSWPSVSGMSLFHRIFSCLSGRFLVAVPPWRPEEVESLNADGLRLPRPLLPRAVPTQPPIFKPIKTSNHDRSCVNFVLLSHFFASVSFARRKKQQRSRIFHWQVAR